MSKKRRRKSRVSILDRLVDSGLWALFFAGLVYGLVIVVQNAPQQGQATLAITQPPSNIIQPDETLSPVNRKLRDAAFKQETQAIQAEQEFQETLGPKMLEDSESVDAYHMEMPFSNDFRQEGAAAKNMEWLERKEEDRDLSPEEKIRMALANKEWLYQYEEEYRREFVRQLIENARRDGFEVLVNKDYEVVDVRRIPIRETLLRVDSQ